jgi:hypothetical protein
MDTVQREKAGSSRSRWLMDAVTVLGVSALWAWIVFDLCTGKRPLRFLDGFFLFVGPILVWQSSWRLVVEWKARRDAASMMG